MIFSEDKWDYASEIKKYVKVSSALSFERIEASLRSAYIAYIIPLVGETMSSYIISIYNEGSSKEYEKTMLEYCQNAVANLAFYSDFDTLSISITDAGIHRTDNEEFKSLYKYQDTNLRESFRNKGFNALDSLLRFLDDYADDIEYWKESETYSKIQNSIIRSTSEVNDVYYINNSRILFLRLLPHFDFVSETILQQKIGTKAYQYIIDNLSKKDDKAEILRKRVSRYIIFLALSRVVRDTGSITDRGLYFISRQSGSNGSGDTNSEPADLQLRAAQSSAFDADARAVLPQILNFLRYEQPELYAGDPERCYDRDNDHKKTFWA